MTMRLRRTVALSASVIAFAGVAVAVSAAWDANGGGNATSAADLIGTAGLTGTTTYNSVTVTPVAPTTGPSVGSYTIKRGTTTVCTTTGTACPDPSLSPSTQYVYTVVPALQAWVGPTAMATFSTPPSPTPAATHYYVVSATGSVSPSNNTWSAAVTLTIKDGTTPLSGYVVKGTWAGNTGTTVSTCTTDASGVCTPNLTNSNIANGGSNTATFTVNSVAATAPATTLPEGSGSAEVISVSKSNGVSVSKSAP